VENAVVDLMLFRHRQTNKDNPNQRASARIPQKCGYFKAFWKILRKFYFLLCTFPLVSYNMRWKVKNYF
jgi:hypothetical protein